MRGLSLIQPWAQAIVCGLKRYETRSWTTSYRGTILIHASARWTAAERRFWRSSMRAAMMSNAPGGPTCNQIHRYGGFEPARSCVIGVADLVGVCDAPGLLAGWESEESHHLERLFGDYGEGRFAWRLENVRPLERPAPCKGALGLWKPTDRLAEAVMDLVA